MLVVGAGPTGLMLALELARRGINLRIVDKLAARSPYSRALVVHARSLELFQNLGIDDAFLAAGYRAIAVSGYVKGRRAVDVELGDIGAAATPFPFILFISQAETERLLEEALNRYGVTVERGVTFGRFVQKDDGVSATIERSDGARETVRCRYLAGCDGAHSAVRRGLNLEFEGAAYEQDFALADVRIDWKLPRDRLLFFLGSPGVLAVFPFNDGRHRIIATVPAGFVDTRKELTLAEAEAIARQISAHELKLSDPVWVSRFRLHHRAVKRYSSGRVFLAGDAAHIHSPAGGQGMNTGIQDAANLAWKLALVLKAQATVRLLASYSAERVPIGRVLLKRTDRFFEIAATGNPLVIALRNFLFPRLFPRVMRNPRLRRGAFRFISQLGIHYRWSPVVLELVQWRRGPAAGERAPDAALRRGNEATSLFETMRGPEHHLLVFAGDTDPIEARRAWHALAGALAFPCRAVVMSRQATDADAVLVDADASAHRLYGIPDAGGIYLIRPDGYVGARAPLATAARALAQYVLVL